MNSDITPTRGPRGFDEQGEKNVPPRPQQLSSGVMDLPPVEPLSSASRPLAVKRSTKWRVMMVIIGVIVSIGVVAGALFGWYQWSLGPASSEKTDSEALTDVVIRPGATPEQIGDTLEEKSIIRSSMSFVIYTRLENVQGALQSGSYKLSPGMSVPQIVDIMTNGQTQQLIITFYPGATLRDPTDTPENQRTDVFTMLQRAGFSDTEITAALAKQYTHPLFEGKPAGTSHEGYVFGETYQFAPGVTAEEILTHTFDVYYQTLKDEGIIAGAKKQGLTLYQAITLASIIEREVHGAADQRQVAQVFYRRLKQDMPLGSDVTFIYAANQQNKTPTVDFDSPYNTRVHQGLPPGPIAAPGVSALQAVVDPAPGDYLYFVAGDDGKTYFSRSEAEHQKNIDEHCQKLCFE